MHEFELIRHYFRARHLRPDVLLGPGDDCALLAPAAHQVLAMTMDTLLEGRHFPADFPARAVGFRSLATNLSDLAAMGAEPAWCLLSLALPTADRHWLDGFCDGFFALAERADISLVGGDLVRGALAVTIQATGFVAAGEALKRSGAKAGDRICIGGVPGEAAAGWQLWQQGQREGVLVERFCYPVPQLALGQQLKGIASSCIDVSDGLLADLGHLLEESGGLGAVVRLADLPQTDALCRAGNEEAVRRWQLAGGDDYLLLFTLPAEVAVPADSFVIGEVRQEEGLVLLDSKGESWQAPSQGWQHF